LSGGQRGARMASLVPPAPASAGALSAESGVVGKSIGMLLRPLATRDPIRTPAPARSPPLAASAAASAPATPPSASPASAVAIGLTSGAASATLARRRRRRRQILRPAIVATALGSGDLQGSPLQPEPPLPKARGSAVVWFRAGDLRVSDHPGLAAAAEAPGGAACCFVFEHREVARLSPRRLSKLRAAVEALRSSLRERCGGAMLHIAVVDDAVAEVSAFCSSVGASEVYVHEDPSDLNVDGLWRLRSLCEDTCSDLRVCSWHAPLRTPAGALRSTCAYDAYAASIAGAPLEEVLPAPKALPQLDPKLIRVGAEGKLRPGDDSHLPSVHELYKAARESMPSASQVQLRESTPYIRGLGLDETGEVQARDMLDVFLKEGTEALAERLWGPPEGGVDAMAAVAQAGVPASKEEWAFRRVARTPSGYGGLIPGEVFSRAFSEQMLWLGCISLREVAARLAAVSQSPEPAKALEAVEAHEWHRLLALRDVAPSDSTSAGEGAAEGHAEIRFWRWRGYLLRYMALRAEDGSSVTPVVAVHGFAASCTQFVPLAEALAEEARRTSGSAEFYALDLLGFGHAEKPPLSFTQYIWEQCVKDFILAVVGRPVVLMGNSIGGYVSQSAAAFVGPDLCKGLVLLNSAGPVLPPEDFAAALQKDGGGTILERMRRGYGSEVGLQEYSPLPQWLIDWGAGLLFGILQPRIEQILETLYPLSRVPVPELAVEILRDSKDPFAANVVASFSRLGPSRSSNELFKEYSQGGRGRLLVCQGMADMLGGGPGNQPRRLEGFTAMCPELRSTAAPLEGCGHCPHHEAPKRVAAEVWAWMSAERLLG